MAGPFTLALSQYAAKAKENADAAVRGVVLTIQSRLVIRSPVDTGRFRANWRYGVGTAPEGVIETTGTTENPTPGAAPPDLVPGEGAGRVHYLVNNLPYAWALERGHSSQAPTGLVALTAIEFQSITDTVAGEVR
jgi:hypothetical protein